MMIEQWIDLNESESITLHIREWQPPGAADKPAFVLLHGLASNARTWDGVAAILADAGCRVFAVDQRGHGLSDKPSGDYGFDTVAADLNALLEELGLERPIVVGQSWGANVVLAYGATYPDSVSGLGFVDGGYLDLQMRPQSTWESISRDLKPPPLAGMRVEEMESRMSLAHPDWSDAGVHGTMGNFEVLADGTIRPWLSLDNHMRILRALWEQRPAMLYSQVKAPVYIAVAENDLNADWTAIKQQQVAAAEEGLYHVRVDRFPSTDHDIHVHRPEELAAAFLSEMTDGVWSNSA